MIKVISIFLMVLWSHGLSGQHVETLNLEQFLAKIEVPSEKTMVYNFWATWCVPCVTEMPILDAVGQRRGDLEVIFVSLDMDTDPNPDKIHRFLERREIKSDVIILNETNSSRWLRRVDRKWKGTLPASLIISPAGESQFIEKQLAEGELELIIVQ